MLILRGIKNLLREAPAKQYAIAMDYTPEVLQASGETGLYSAQVNLAIKRIQRNDITAIYGFSGGGYNLVHIWSRLNQDHRNQIKKIVVLGAPGVVYKNFAECEDVDIFNNPAIAHMMQPDNYLDLNT